MPEERINSEPNEIFIERVKSDPKSITTVEDDQLRLIHMTQEGRRLKGIWCEQDLRVKLGEEAEEILIRANEGLINKVLQLKGIRLTDKKYEDAHQVALMGLVKAIRSYDDKNDKRANFGTYAFVTIKSEIGTNSEEIFGLSKDKRNKIRIINQIAEQGQRAGLNVTLRYLSEKSGMDILTVLGALYHAVPIYLEDLFTNNEDPNESDWSSLIPNKRNPSENDAVTELDFQKAKGILTQQELKYINLVLDRNHAQKEIAEILKTKPEKVRKIGRTVRQKMFITMRESDELMAVGK